MVITSTETIAVGAVDNHALVREGLENQISKSPNMRLAGTVADGAGLKRLMSLDPPDVILMDIKLENENGLELTDWLLKTYPEVHVIVLSNYDEGPFVIEAISVGAAGYLLKDCSSALLLHTIHAVTHGGVLFKKELLMRAFEGLKDETSAKDRVTRANLTEEDWVVLEMMETGAHNRAIARKLLLSEATVKNRVQTILVKLDASNRTEAVAIATRGGVARPA